MQAPAHLNASNVLLSLHLCSLPPTAVILDEGSPKRRTVPDGDGTNLGVSCQRAEGGF